MGGIFSKPKMPAPPPPPPKPPAVTDPEVKQSAADARKRAARAKGRASTILTSGQGLTGDATVGGKTTLGG